MKYGGEYGADVHSFAEYPDYGHEFAHHPAPHHTPVHDMHNPIHGGMYGHNPHSYLQHDMEDYSNSQHFVDHYDHHDTHHKDMEWLGH
jgi:hypothetical protein